MSTASIKEAAKAKLEKSRAGNAGEQAKVQLELLKKQIEGLKGDVGNLHARLQVFYNRIAEVNCNKYPLKQNVKVAWQNEIASLLEEVSNLHAEL